MKDLKEMGIKFDKGKLLWGLVPWEEMKAVVRVLMGGASKYTPDNWMHVEPDRYREAIMRHVIDYTGGETIDPDSGESHLAHVICNALFLMWHDKGKIGAPIPLELKPRDHKWKMTILTPDWGEMVNDCLTSAKVN